MSPEISLATSTAWEWEFPEQGHVLSAVLVCFVYHKNLDFPDLSLGVDDVSFSLEIKNIETSTSIDSIR